MKLLRSNFRTNVSGLSLRLLLLAAMVWTNAFAQSNAPAESSPKTGSVSIETLLKRISELEAAQKQMQGKLDKLTGAPQPAPIASNPAPAAPIAAVQDAVDPSSSEPSEPGHTLGPVQFQGFSDFDYGRSWFEKLPSGGLAGTPRSFNIGDFDLFTNTRLSEHWSILGELLVTSDFSNEFSAELDRLLLTYKQNDYFKVSVGKFSTSLGYYTNAYHRAQYFQTGIGRPIMYSDEDNGGILPVHNVGVTATGKIPSGSLGLHWVAEIANGRSASSVPIQNFVDENNGKAVNLAVYVRPDWLHGFQAGFSAYRDTMRPAGEDPIQQAIFTSHIAYVGARLEWLNEAAVVRHVVEGTRDVFHSTTAYTQVAWAFGKTRPYMRYDYQNVPAGDPVFGLLGRRSGPSFGLNRHVSNYVGFKIQYGLLGQRGSSSANGLTAQLAIAF
jgi:hypothetical protein